MNRTLPAIIGIAAVAWIGTALVLPLPESHPYVALDGDTIRTGAGPDIRLARVDAAELPGHCRRGRRCASGNALEQKALLQSILDSGSLYCHDLGNGGYGRRLAECFINDQNVSNWLLASGMDLYEP